MSLPASSVVSNSVVRTFHGSTPTLFWDPSYSNCIGTKIRNNYELSNFSGLVYIYTWIVQCTEGSSVAKSLDAVNQSTHREKWCAVSITPLFLATNNLSKSKFIYESTFAVKLQLKDMYFYVCLLTKRDKISTTEFNPMKDVPFWQWLILPWLYKLSLLI